MDEREKTFLMSVISLDKKIRENDKSVAAEIAFLKEYEQDKPGNMAQVYDLILKAIEESNGNNKDLLHYAVGELSLKNREYLQHLIDMPKEYNIPAMKAYLENIFGVYITIEDPEVKFGFYNKVVFMALQVGDPDLIEKQSVKLKSCKIRSPSASAAGGFLLWIRVTAKVIY